MTLPLYTSGRIEHGISLAEARKEAARSRVNSSRKELIFNLASGFYTGLRLKRVIAAQESVLKSLGESQRVAELQREVGRISLLDVLRIETRVSQGERDLAVVNNAYAQILEILKALVEVPTEQHLEITGELVPAPTGIAFEALRDEALTRRPDLIALRREVDARRAAMGVAGAALGPTLDFKAGYRGVTGSDSGDTQADATLFLQFRMPLYEGGVLRAQKRKALAKLREAEQRLHEAERRALSELKRTSKRRRNRKTMSKRRQRRPNQPNTAMRPRPSRRGRRSSPRRNSWPADSPFFRTILMDFSKYSSQHLKIIPEYSALLIT